MEDLKINVPFDVGKRTFITLFAFAFNYKRKVASISSCF